MKISHPNKSTTERCAAWNIVEMRFFTLVPIFFLTIPLFATSAIAIRTPKRIMLASDSKGSFQDKSINVECKIYGYGDVFFTLSGIPYDRNRGYDVAHIVRQGFSRKGDFRQRVSMTKNLLKRALSDELRRLRREDSKGYEWAIKKSSEPLQLALAQYEGEIPVLAVLEFNFDRTSKSLNAIEHWCPGDCIEGSHAYYLGHHEAIDAFLKTHPVVGTRDTLNLMRLELKDRPDEVGEPINILEVSPAGPKWLVGGNSCKLD